MSISVFYMWGTKSPGWYIYLRVRGFCSVAASLVTSFSSIYTTSVVVCPAVLLSSGRVATLRISLYPTIIGPRTLIHRQHVRDYPPSRCRLWCRYVPLFTRQPLKTESCNHHSHRDWFVLQCIYDRPYVPSNSIYRILAEGFRRV